MPPGLTTEVHCVRASRGLTYLSTGLSLQECSDGTAVALEDRMKYTEQWLLRRRPISSCRLTRLTRRWWQFWIAQCIHTSM